MLEGLFCFCRVSDDGVFESYVEYRNKTIVYYFDAISPGSNYAVNEQDSHWVYQNLNF